MGTRIYRVSPADANSLAIRLHDATAGIALGSGFLKADQFGDGYQLRRREAIQLIEQALARLRLLEHELRRSEIHDEPADLMASLGQHAQSLNITLELRVTGSPESLAPSQLELLRLAGREAMLNVRKHSSSQTCRIDLDLTSCPFRFRARDWGAGLRGRSDRSHGLTLLAELATWLGCQVSTSSQPGLGTELVILGPPFTRVAGSPSQAEEEVASS